MFLKCNHWNLVLLAIIFSNKNIVNNWREVSKLNGPVTFLKRL